MFVTTAVLFVLAQEPDAGEPVDARVSEVATLTPVVVDAGTPHEKPKSAELKATWGEGVAVKSGDFSFQIRGRVQVRAESFGPGPETSAARVNEFMIRRARLALTAKYTDDWTMNVQLAFATQDMESDAPNVLRDAYLTWSHFRDLNVRVGQTKVPFGRQRVISSGNQQMVDRSIVVGELNLDRDVGVLLRSDDLFGLGGKLSYTIGVMGGDGRNRLGTNVGLLYVARVQVAPFGKFDDLVGGDLERLDKPRLAFGLAGARNVATVRQRSTFGTTFKNGSLTTDHLAADLIFKYAGFSLEAEALLRYAEKPNLVGATSTEWARAGWGYYLQAGYSPVQSFELSARWGQLRPFDGTDPSFHHQRELGIGAGWFPKKHDLKLQGDLFWLPVGENFGNGSWQARVQLQLYF